MPIAFVKNVGSLATKTSGTVFSITVPAAGVAAGSRVICRIATNIGVSTATITGADTRGNTYAKDNLNGLDPNTPVRFTFVVSAHIATALVSGDTITLTVSTASSATVLVIDEFTGIQPTSPYTTPLDSRGDIVTNVTTPVPLYTTTVGDLLALTTCSSSYGVTFTFNAGWTVLTSAVTSGGGSATNRDIYGAWQLATSTGSTAAVTSCTPTPSAATYHYECLFGYLAASAVTPPSASQPVGQFLPFF